MSTILAGIGVVTATVAVFIAAIFLRYVIAVVGLLAALVSVVYLAGTFVQGGPSQPPLWCVISFGLMFVGCLLVFDD